MGKRGRLAIVTVAAAVVFGVPAVILNQSNEAVDEEVAEVRLRARTAAVSQEAIEAATLRGDWTLMPDLGVNAAKLGLSRNGPAHWCLTVHLEKTIVTRDVQFLVDSDSSLRPVGRC